MDNITDEKYLQILGKRIRDKRKEKKMSQEVVAQLCEMEKANLSRIETGKTNTTVLTLRKLSKVLFGHVSELFVD